MNKINILLTSAFLFFSVEAVATPKYAIKDLGSLGEPSFFGSGSFGYAINNSGQITGDSIVRTVCTIYGCHSISHAFMWDPKTNKMIDLGGFNDFSVNIFGSGRGINNKGQVTGSAETSTERGHAFLWNNKTAHMIDLGTFEGASSDYWSVGNSINDKGQVAGLLGGYNEGLQRPPHAFIWHPKTGNMKDIGTLCDTDTAGCYSEGRGINSKGQVTGLSITNDRYGGAGVPHAFFWNPANAKMKDTGTLCGPKVLECFSEGYAINSKGQVTGDSEFEHVDGSETHAFLWTRETGKLLDLGTLNGGRSVGLGINAYGHVVGSSQYSDSEPAAFIWKRKAGMVDLNKLIPCDSGWYLREATAINNRGQIVANGYHPILGTHAVLLTPK